MTSDRRKLQIFKRGIVYVQLMYNQTSYCLFVI